MPFNIIEVKNIDELNDQILKLPPVGNGHKRLYRGQNRDYNGLMIPSFYRGEDIYNTKDYSWKLAGQRIIKEEIFKIEMNTTAGMNDPSMNFPIDGLVQHYGLRSGGLDVTSDINVALWFAQFKREEEEVFQQLRLLHNDKVAVFSLRKAYYHFAGAGFSYIYVFDCPLWIPGNRPSNGDCVDLHQWYGQYTSRPAKQKAWYIYADNAFTPKGDLQSFVKVAFKIPNELHKVFDNTATFYFPSPEDDKIFYRLLNSYFIENDDGIFERILDIPQYYDTREQITGDNVNDSYIKTFRITSYNNYFKALSNNIKANNGGIYIYYEDSKFSFIDAERIKMKIPDWYISLAESDKEGNFYIPKLEDVVFPFEKISYNYFIEFSNCELVAYKDPEARVMRGVWIVQQNNKIGIQFFYFTKEGFSTSKTIWFQKSENSPLTLLDDDVFFVSEVTKKYYQNSVVIALRVLQTYKKIPFFPKFVPFRFVYG